MRLVAAVELAIDSTRCDAGPTPPPVLYERGGLRSGTRGSHRLIVAPAPWSCRTPSLLAAPCLFSRPTPLVGRCYPLKCYFVQLPWCNRSRASVARSGRGSRRVPRGARRSAPRAWKEQARAHSSLVLARHPRRRGKGANA